MSPSKRAVLSGKCTQNMDTKSQSPALWYPHLTGCHCTFWGICRHCQILPPLSFFCALAKFLLWTSTKIYSHWQCTKTVQFTIHKMCQIQPLNCATPAQIEPFRGCILHPVMTWRLSSRELKNKIALIQDFPGWGCFCCRLILKKCSYTLNTSNFWILLEAHLPFSQLLHCQAGLETFQEQDFDFQYIVILL